MDLLSKLLELTGMAALTSGFLVGLAVLLKNGARTWFEKHLTAQFDVELERVRSTLRHGEETLKAELRKAEEIARSEIQVRQADIAALRSIALSGFDKRQEGFEKRRVESIELIWSCAGRLRESSVLAFAMSTQEFEKLAEHFKTSGKMRQFLEGVTKDGLLDRFGEIDASAAALYVSPMSWILYDALHRVVAHAHLKYHSMKSGVSINVVNFASEVELLKAALPEKAHIIENEAKYGGGLLFDALYRKLADELRRDIRGEEIDQELLRRAAAYESILSDREQQATSKALSEVSM